MNKEVEIELPADSDSIQENIELKKLEVHQSKDCEAMSEDEEDPIAALTSLILADEEISASNDNKSEPTSRSDERRAKIKQAILTLESILAEDLEMFLKNSEKRGSLKSSLEILQDTSDDDVIVGFKSFVLQLGEQLPSMLECMDKASTIEGNYQSLASRKEELVSFSKSTSTRKQQLDEDRQVYLQNVETNSQQILAIKARIAELENELKQLKATQVNLEAAMKDVDFKDQVLKQQAKDAINEFKATSSKMVSMEVERKAVNAAKVQAFDKWNDFKGTFNINFKKIADSL